MDGTCLDLHNSNIMKKPIDETMPPQLPTYALYGEHGKTMDVEWLHVESIAARSRLHDWEIKPHRHDSLFQILYIRRGRAMVTAEGAVRRIEGPCVVTVPSLTAHGFSFSSRVDGLVITVLEQHLRELLAREPSLQDQALRLRRDALDATSVEAVDTAAVSLRGEFLSTAPWRSLAIDAALLRLVVALSRCGGEDVPQAHEGERAVEHVRRFRALVEQRFRGQANLSHCAQTLGITPTQLNRVCHRVLGQSALSVMNARVVLEAQRELAYTTLSVKHIALGLGFADPAYFTRFFLRETGRTPTEWRMAARKMNP